MTARLSKSIIYQSGNFDRSWNVGTYIMETIWSDRQADYILPKLGSTYNYVTKLMNLNQLAATKINLNFARKPPLVEDPSLYSSLPESINIKLLCF